MADVRRRTSAYSISIKPQEIRSSRSSKLVLILLLAALFQGIASSQQNPADQWPNYQHNSNFSPLTQITPANVATLVPAWTFNYGAGSAESGGVGLDYRFEVQPLLIGGVMYISTPASQRDPNLRSTVTALEPETGKFSGSSSLSGAFTAVASPIGQAAATPGPVYTSRPLRAT